MTEPTATSTPGSPRGATDPDRRPNVLFVICDQLPPTTSASAATRSS